VQDRCGEPARGLEQEDQAVGWVRREADRAPALVAGTVLAIARALGESVMLSNCGALLTSPEVKIAWLCLPD
jgi:hypothetical protein